MDYEYMTLYENALALFRKAGFTASYTPLTADHSFKQAVYLDTEKAVYVDKGLLNSALEVSHLFNLGNEYFNKRSGSIDFYSVRLHCLKKSRSQVAHDVHSILHNSFSVETSVVLFCHDNYVMLSVAGIGGDVVLSEWYDFFYDFEALADLLNIGQFSVSSAHQFAVDLIYTVARTYYLEPDLQGVSLYSILPLTYYGNGLLRNEEAGETLPAKELIAKTIRDRELEYGDDYVHSEHGVIRDISAFEDELARLSFELELQDEGAEADSPLDGTSEVLERDDYEYGDVDPEIFNDPTLMLEWLDSQSAKTTESDVEECGKKQQVSSEIIVMNSDGPEQLDFHYLEEQNLLD